MEFKQQMGSKFYQNSPQSLNISHLNSSKYSYFKGFTFLSLDKLDAQNFKLFVPFLKCVIFNIWYIFVLYFNLSDTFKSTGHLRLVFITINKIFVTLKLLNVRLMQRYIILYIFLRKHQTVHPFQWYKVSMLAYNFPV